MATSARIKSAAKQNPVDTHRHVVVVRVLQAEVVFLDDIQFAEHLLAQLLPQRLFLQHKHYMRGTLILLAQTQHERHINTTDTNTT